MVSAAQGLNNMSGMEWVRVQCSTPDDPKIRELRRGPEGDMYYLIWLNLIMYAGKCGIDGKLLIASDIPATAETLAEDLRFNVDVMHNALSRLKALRLLQNVTLGSVKILKICNWECYQFVSSLENLRSKNAKRQARYRAKKKEQERNVTSNVTSNVTHNVTDNVTVTTQRREEKSKSNNNYSYSSSQASKSNCSAELAAVESELASLPEVPAVQGATVSQLQLKRHSLEQRRDMLKLQLDNQVSALG